MSPFHPSLIVSAGDYTTFLSTPYLYQYRTAHVSRTQECSSCVHSSPIPLQGYLNFRLVIIKLSKIHQSEYLFPLPAIIGRTSTPGLTDSILFTIKGLKTFDLHCHILAGEIKRENTLLDILFLTT